MQKTKPKGSKSHHLPTIYAWATTPGRAGVAVLRVSGAECKAIADALGITSLAPRKAHLATLTHPETKEMIDQALSLYFPAPHSFTGEEVLELHTHGSPSIRVTLSNVLSQFTDCRLAEPGEFTQRAFLHGKMDLTQAEGLADLIAAETEAQRKQALAQMQGRLGDYYESLRQQVLRALALMEAYIDFPDEEIPNSVYQETQVIIAECLETITTALSDDRAGETIRDGFTVAIIGPPNAGKSSLLNYLAKREVAIVSDIEGTTRDSIEVNLNINGYLVRFIDTAGLRESTDQIEQEGIRRSHQAAQDADMTIVIMDIVTISEQYQLFKDYINESNLILANKVDQSGPTKIDTAFPCPAIAISAKTGEGVEKLLQYLTQQIEKNTNSHVSPVITQTRHREALLIAQAQLNYYHSSLPIELNTEHLRLAAQSIGKITGKVDVDAILDIIFKEFCIGK